MPSETLDDFIERHGEFIEVDFGVRIFADGAVANEKGFEGMPIRQEPPSDPREALSLRRQYAEAKRRHDQTRSPTFAEVHGGDPVIDCGQLVYPDGAVTDRTGNFQTEPPRDPILLLQSQRRYLDAKLRVEIEAFTSFQQSCREAARLAAQYQSCPPPPADAAEQLRRGNRRIKALRNQLAELDAELAATKASTRHGHQQNDYERKRHLSEQLRDLTAIELP